MIRIAFYSAVLVVVGMTLAWAVGQYLAANFNLVDRVGL